jgi:hypothetical protein
MRDLTLFNNILYNTGAPKALQADNCQPIANSLGNRFLTTYISQTHLDTAKYFRIFAVWERVHG